MILSGDPPSPAGLGVTGTVEAATIGRGSCDGLFLQTPTVKDVRSCACRHAASTALPTCGRCELRAAGGVISHRRHLSAARGLQARRRYMQVASATLLTAIRASLLRTVPGSASMVTLAGAIGKCHLALAGAGSRSPVSGVAARVHRKGRD